MVTPFGLGCWQFSKQKNLAGKFWPTLEDSQIERIVSLSMDGGINWLIHYHGDTVEAIAGATKEIHVRENCGAMTFRLSGEDMVKLDHVSSGFK